MNKTTPSDTLSAQQHSRQTHVRYAILAMLFLVTLVNYADRSAISIAGPALQDDLHIDSVTMGYIFSAFSWAYVIAQIPGGWLLDRYGSRRVYAISILFWSFSHFCRVVPGCSPPARL